jgi:hypothetical protein
MLFLSETLPPDYQYRIGEELKITVDEGIDLSCVYIKNENPKGVILYLHGNKGNNKRCTYQAKQFILDGYDLVMPDYRGYGKSDGIIESEEQLLSDVQKVYDFLKNTYTEDEITIAAYSLGTGMASYLAANNNPKELFLVSPYLSITDLKDNMYLPIPDVMVKYPLNTLNNLSQVKCKVSIFHGTDDELIPYESSQIIKNTYPEVDFYTLEDATHRSSIFHAKINEIFRLALL